MNMRILALTTLAAAAMSVAAAGDVIEYERAADLWLADNPDAEGRAFDEFYTSDGGNGCVLPPGQVIASMELEDGTVTVTATNYQSNVVCAVRDTASGQQHSDGFIAVADSTLTFEFAPAIYGFYGFYGSLGINHTATMYLYDGGQLVAEITGPVGEDQLALGHGFVSIVPIDRVVIDKTDQSGVMLGAFIGLHEGEPSLGTVTIPGYDGPTGEIVELDFAVVWPECVAADIDGSGVVDIGDFLILLSQWGPDPALPAADVDGDGVVGVLDFLLLLGFWGPCN